MNTNNVTVNVGAEVNAPAVINKKKVGRPVNPLCIRTIFLNADKTPRGKGSPRPLSEIVAIDVQRSVKNSEFKYGVTPQTNERTIIVPARQKRATVKVVVNQPNPVAPVAETPAAPVVENVVAQVPA